MSDFTAVTRKLTELGGKLCWVFRPKKEYEVANKPAIIELHLWTLADTGIMVSRCPGGKCGLYLFRGVPGEPIEEDLKFLEGLVPGGKWDRLEGGPRR